MVLVDLEALPLHVGVALREIEIRLDHLAHELLEARSRGCQPSLARALVASPSSVSTSVGRK